MQQARAPSLQPAQLVEVLLQRLQPRGGEGDGLGGAGPEVRPHIAQALMQMQEGQPPSLLQALTLQAVAHVLQALGFWP